MENPIKIRPIEEKDIKYLIPYLNEKKIQKFTKASNDIKRIKEIIENYKLKGKGEKRVITLGETEKIIGSIVIKNIKERSKKADIGYRIGKDFEGKGIMTEALYMFLKYVFIKKKLERIQALVKEGNIGSIKLLEKLGFSHEGILRNFKKKNNRYYNYHIYSILKEDFNRLTRKKK